MRPPVDEKSYETYEVAEQYGRLAFNDVPNAGIIGVHQRRNFEIKHPDFAYAGPNALTPVIVEVGKAQHMLNPRLIASIEHEAAES